MAAPALCCKEEMMKRLIGLLLPVFLLALCFCPSVAAAQGESDGEPSPVVLPLAEDRAGVLTSATIERIEREGAVLRDLTGVEPLVVTVDFLGGKAIADYARDVFDARQPGAEHNNGLLLLLCTGEEDYYLLTGKGLEGALPSDMLLSILDQCMEADFEAGDYDAAVAKTFDRLRAQIEQGYGVSVAQELTQREAAALEPSPKNLRWLWWLVPIFFLLLACLLLPTGRRNRRRRRKVV